MHGFVSYRNAALPTVGGVQKRLEPAGPYTKWAAQLEETRYSPRNLKKKSWTTQNATHLGRTLHSS